MITHFDTEKFKTKFACELKVTTLQIFDRKEANKLDRFAQYALYCRRGGQRFRTEPG